jgi:hypothetical protein
MQLRRLIVLSSLVLAVTALSPVAALGAATNGTNRPLNGSGSGSGLTTLVGGVPATYVIDGTLHYSHFGLSTFHVDGVCTNPDCTTSTFTTTIVAANGDTSTSSSTSTGTATTFTNLDTTTGGTGRFAGASGTSTTTGTSVTDPSNPLAFTITFTTSGTISY